MKPPVSDALSLCLLLSRVAARLELSMEDRLGEFHGLAFRDFSLLQFLASAPDGRIAMPELGQALGMKLSAVTRKVIELEKVGLAQREVRPASGGARVVCLSPAGRRLMRETETTARAACTTTVGALAEMNARDVERALTALCDHLGPQAPRPERLRCARENPAP